ncbi:MAG: hypothetical protein IIX48_05190 [Lachnospiraceae bacterium]|nr:hypothetical protein [Lachnospiraceae bacterium]
MEKGLFNAGDKYRICDNCGEWVKADQLRCDKCHEHISNFDFYTVEEKFDGEKREAPLAKNLGQQEATNNGGKLKCLICDTVADAGVTLCPNCNNATLIPMDDEEGKSGTSDTEAFSDAALLGNTQFFDAIDTQVENKYYFEGEILTGHGRKIGSRKKIWIGAQDIIVGRRFFIENQDLFFDGYTDELQQRFKVISTENAVISLKSGQITIRKCRGEASKIRMFRMNTVTGNVESDGELEGTREYTLKPGDCLEFGNGEDHHRHVMLTFGRDGGNEVQNQEQRHTGLTDRFEKLNAMMMQVIEGNKSMEERMSSMEESLNSFEQVIARINIDELAIKSGETQGEYDRRIDEQVPQAQELTKEQEIKNFLKVRMNSGNIKDCSYQYEVVKDRQQIVDYLWQAAFYERVCNAQYEINKDIDYSVVINCIGRAFEEYICTYLLKIIYASQREEFEKEMESARVKLGSIPQGRICNYLLFYDICNGQKVYKRVNKVVEAAGYGSDRNHRIEFRNAVENAKLATQNRNAGSHANASKHTSKDAIDKYIEENESRHISKDEYLAIKATVFGEKTLSTLKNYYDKVCK